MSTTTRTRVKLDPAWWQRTNALTERHVKATTAGTAQKVRDLAPVATGAYADSIWDVTKIAAGVWTGYVGSTDFARHLIEFGGARTPAYAPMRRAAAATGLKIAGRR
jgi:hypothetical protein